MTKKYLWKKGKQLENCFSSHHRFFDREHVQCGPKVARQAIQGSIRCQSSMREKLDIGPIFLQTIPILVQAQKNWSWIGIIFDWMILLRIFVFRDHLKGHFWDSQQPIIVYELSWLSFDFISLNHVHYVPYYLWR